MQPPATLNQTTTNRTRAILSADWFAPKSFALLLALLVFASFPQVLLGLQTFVVRDFGFFAYPLAHFQRECFWRGEVPLWNPYNNCGVPFLAQWNTMPLYPGALIYLLLPLTWSLSFFCLLHLWFAGLGAYFLARRWTGDNFAAAFAGVAFAFNGMTLNLLMWPSHIATFAWMPWVVLAVERAWREGGQRIFIAALAGAMQMLAGGPETILFTWLVLAALWVGELLSARGRPARSSDGAENTCGLTGGLANAAAAARMAVLRFPLVVALVAMLAAAQLLPFLDLVAHSQRETGFADTRWSVPSSGWANFLVPMAFGHISNMGVFFQANQGWTSSYYLGMATLVLVAVGICSVRQKRVWLLTAIAGCALIFAFGEHTFIYRGLRQLIPQLSFMTYPVKFLLLVTFLAPLLAAFALARSKIGEAGPDRAPAKATQTWLGIGAALLALLVAVLIWSWRSPAVPDMASATLVNGLTRVVFLVASVGLLVASVRMTKPAFQRVAPLALLLVVWLDVLTHMPTQNPTVAPWIYEPGLARVKLAMQPQPGPGESRAMLSAAAAREFTQFVSRKPEDNFIIKRLGYFANCNLLDGVPKVNGFFSLYPRECGELNAVLYGSTNLHASGLLDFLAVSQMTAPGRSFEWMARTNFSPLITAGQTPVFLDDINAERLLFRPDFDGRKVVMLPPEAKSTITVTNPAVVRLKGWRFTAQRVDLEVEAASAALVVVAQTYFHCWRAYVDGGSVPLWRANYAFQAVEVPAGNHQVGLVYEDRAFRVGAWISALAWLVCAAGCALCRRPKQSN